MASIDVSGDIISNDDKWIYDWLGWEATSPSDIKTALSECKPGETLTVHINSGGGSVMAGQEIFSMLYGRNDVEIKIQSLAGSAASVIAMANRSEISPVAMIMIHNVSMWGASGDYHDMQKNAEILKNMNAALAAAYTAKHHPARDCLGLFGAYQSREVVSQAECATRFEPHDGNPFLGAVKHSVDQSRHFFSGALSLTSGQPGSATAKRSCGSSAVWADHTEPRSRQHFSRGMKVFRLEPGVEGVGKQYHRTAGNRPLVGVLIEVLSPFRQSSVPGESGYAFKQAWKARQSISQIGKPGNLRQHRCIGR